MEKRKMYWIERFMKKEWKEQQRRFPMFLFFSTYFLLFSKRFPMVFLSVLWLFQIESHLPSTKEKMFKFLVWKHNNVPWYAALNPTVRDLVYTPPPFTTTASLYQIQIQQRIKIEGYADDIWDVQLTFWKT